MPEESAPTTYPPGFLEEFDNQVTIYSILVLVLCTFFVGLRFVARAIGKVAWGWDDTFLVPATILTLAIAIGSICDVKYGGVGYHTPRVVHEDPHKLIIWAKLALTLAIMYYPAVTFPKLSILALYQRVFRAAQNKKTVAITYITAGLIVGNCIGNLVTAFLVCRPFARFWDKKIPGECINVNDWWRWSSLVNIITDIIMLILPLPGIIKLQTTSKVKAGLLATFITGSIGLVTAIIRFVGFFQHDFQADPTWDAVSLVVLTTVEPGLYLIAASLLAFRPLLRYLLKISPFSSMTPTRNNKSHNDEGQSHILQKISYTVSSRDNGFRPIDEGSTTDVREHEGIGNHPHVARSQV